MKTNKLLMIVNEFPPTGESGVQRPLKFMKYLDKLDWEVHVITPAKPTKTILDYTLLNEIPIGIIIHYTRSMGIKGKAVDKIADVRFKFAHKRNMISQIGWKLMKSINDNVFPLDKQIGWFPFALIESLKVIKQYQLRNIYITGFPFSSFLVGICLKIIKRKDLFWVADYRDAWQFEPILDANVSKYRKKIITWVDELTLRKCDRVVFSSEYVKGRYIEKYKWLYLKAKAITNGFDEDDFENLKPVSFGKYTLLYMGKIYENKGNPLSLLEAVDKCNMHDYQYLHIGTISKEVRLAIEQKGFDFYRFEGYKPHSAALNYAAGADINIIVLNDDEESKGVIPGKIFELLRIGKPILAVGPKQSLIKHMIEQTNSGLYADIGDIDDIVKQLNLLIGQTVIRNTSLQSISMYSRLELTKQLASLFPHI